MSAEVVGERQVLHVLDRVAFGPTQDDVRHVTAMGINRYIDEQLSPESVEEPAALTEKLARSTR